MSKSEPEVFTKCEDCVFEKDLECTLGKMDLFTQNGGTIQVKNGHVFISGRQCNFKRDNNWYLKYKDNIDEQLTIESNIKYGIIINSSSFENLTKAIDFTLQQSILPQSIYVVYNKTDLINRLVDIQDLLTSTKLKWSLKRPLEVAKHEFDFINEYISTGVVKEGYILYIQDKNIPQSNLIQKINYSINVLLKQVMVYRDFDYIFTATTLAQIFGLDYLSEAIYNAGHGDKISRIT